MKKILFGGLLSSVLVLAGCSGIKQSEQPSTQFDEQALSAFVWQLDKVQQPSSSAAQSSAAAQQADLPQAPATMRPFELLFSPEQRVGVQGLCNTLSGGYSLKGDEIAIQQMISTRMMCSDESLMQLENYVGQVLPAAQQWSVQGLELDSKQWANATPVLKLIFSNGMQWQLQGQPTAETRFGQAGETSFLEVQPTLEACKAQDGDCYTVRQLQYNEQGLQTTTGPWMQISTQQLQGFVPEPNVQSVIRTQRYTEKGTAGEERPVYVFDMLVESERL